MVNNGGIRLNAAVDGAVAAATGNDAIRVGIVDDHLVLVDALRMIVQSQKDLLVVGTGGSCAEGLALAQKERPQVMLLDVALPDGDGINLVAAIKAVSPETSVLILTSLADESTLLRAMNAGVSGFVSKSRNLLEVLNAIRQAAAGEIAVPAGLLLGLLNRSTNGSNGNGSTHGGLGSMHGGLNGAKNNGHHPPTAGPDALTQREREILALLARGRSGEAIAEELCITPLTVRTHIRNLMQKLGVRSRLEAVTTALRSGLIDPPA